MLFGEEIPHRPGCWRADFRGGHVLCQVMSFGAKLLPLVRNAQVRLCRLPMAMGAVPAAVIIDAGDAAVDIAGDGLVPVSDGHSLF